MPLPPVREDSFDKVNFVIDSWVLGCDAPWYIYLETMKPAALEAFIVLITFGWADVLRGALRPKGLGRRTHKKKGGWSRKRPSFPEVGNTLGKSLPFAEQIDDYVKWGTKTKFLWRIDTAMQVGLFYWLVADVVEDFAFNWTSLLYESYWCQPDPPGKFSYHRTGNQSQPAHVWRKINYPDQDYQYPPPHWTYSNGWSGPTGCSVAATATFEQFSDFDPPTGGRVRVKNDGNPTVYGDSGLVSAEPNNVTPVVVTAQVPPYTLFRVETWHGGTWADVGNGVVLGIETKLT